jgi:hypothetical protein
MNDTSAYRDISDEEIDEVFRRFILRILSPRALCITLIYAAAISLSDIPAWKTLVFCAAVWLLMVLPLGRTYIEKAGGIWFFAALVAWLDFPPVNRAIDTIGARLATLL